MRAALRRNCFRPGAEMVSFDTARRYATAVVKPLKRSQEVPLACAAGRVLAATIEAPHDLPSCDQAAMDGYAVCLSGRNDVPLVLPVAGRTSAGDPPGILAPGTAHRIMTGAALPSGADTVVMQEHVTHRGGLVQFGPDIEAGTHIRKAGEDIALGTAVLQSGVVVGWPEIALLAGLGVEMVSVARPLRIAVLATGSELRRGGKPLQPGTIYDSNGPMLAALLATPNTHVTSLTVRDDVAAIADALQTQAGSVDLVITTAGMSVGDEDHVRDAIARAGGRLDFVKVAMKPGKPLAFGKVGNAHFIGLPGNPQAAAFGALAFVRPMVRALLGQSLSERITAEMGFTCARKPNRTELLPIRLSVESGRLVASRAGRDGSHRMTPIVSADAIAIMPGGATPIEVGACLEVLPFDQPRFGR